MISLVFHPDEDTTSLERFVIESLHNDEDEHGTPLSRLKALIDANSATYSSEAYPQFDSEKECLDFIAEHHDGIVKVINKAIQDSPRFPEMIMKKFSFPRLVQYAVYRVACDFLNQVKD